MRKHTRVRACVCARVQRLGYEPSRTGCDRHRRRRRRKRTLKFLPNTRATALDLGEPQLPRWQHERAGPATSMSNLSIAHNKQLPLMRVYQPVPPVPLGTFPDESPAPAPAPLPPPPQSFLRCACGVLRKLVTLAVASKPVIFVVIRSGKGRSVASVASVAAVDIPRMAKLFCDSRVLW